MKTKHASLTRRDFVTAGIAAAAVAVFPSTRASIHATGQQPEATAEELLDTILTSGGSRHRHGCAGHDFRPIRHRGVR